MPNRTTIRPGRWAGACALILLATILPGAAPYGGAGAIPPAPAATTSATTQVLAVSTGGWITCAIRLDGTLACWGDPGDPDEGTLMDFANLPSGSFKAVSVGGQHACAIRLDDTLLCWGSNGYGQADSPDGTFKKVSAGYDHTCAIRR